MYSMLAALETAVKRGLSQTYTDGAKILAFATLPCLGFRNYAILAVIRLFHNLSCHSNWFTISLL